MIEHLILKLIEHILAVIGLTIARSRSSNGEEAGEDVKLGPVSEDQVGEGKKDGEDDRRPEEVDVGVDRQKAVLVEQPGQCFCRVLHF